MPAVVAFSHDVDLEGPLASALSGANIRLAGHPGPKTIHLMHHGGSVAVIADPEAMPIFYLNEPIDAKALVAAIHTASDLLEAKDAVREAKMLLEIARALGSERDRDKLYRLIVRKARELTRADSGTLFVIETDGRKKSLRFAVAQTGPHDEETHQGGVLPLSATSIAGSVALSGKAVRLKDVYKDAAAQGLHFDKSFDEAKGYRTKSMLCAPLTGFGGETIGVLALINRKPSFEMPLLSSSITQSAVEAFDEHDEEIIAALAGHAGLALNNAVLHAK